MYFFSMFFFVPLIFFLDLYFFGLFSMRLSWFHDLCLSLASSHELILVFFFNYYFFLILSFDIG